MVAGTRYVIDTLNFWDFWTNCAPGSDEFMVTVR
jgi:hypothetical protein